METGKENLTPLRVRLKESQGVPRPQTRLRARRGKVAAVTVAGVVKAHYAVQGGATPHEHSTVQ